MITPAEYCVQRSGQRSPTPNYGVSRRSRPLQDTSKTAPQTLAGFGGGRPAKVLDLPLETASGLDGIIGKLLQITSQIVTTLRMAHSIGLLIL
ncbi:hypothetical protein HRR83_007417 [Exophiala dermatitidis]|nr:hypothetical protein HRR74_006863 [Exophiala dermatitidis]KAJ4510674.1 hypothetical protein HRR73_006746 [Exophiala dermatitidis]KAJ4576068.1 hypothetical protein HRR81_003956 [Exophiala dermatitidis]KAJ4591485.1 hypothetical protein HRR83_007417 [Exophiala dermatitidis]KAJ4601109.1 hypothetical protein HRR84_002991 [Exophiala dermatitidis]